MPREVDPVASIVRQSDPDRYLASLYAPSGCRPALLALAAFDIETARIRDLVSQPLPGEIRLQWWREVVSGERVTEAVGHPVAEPLVAAIEAFDLPRPPLENLCDARVFDLYDDPMPDRTALEGYCGETVSALIQLGALVLDPAGAAITAEQAGHAGCALGLVRILRRLPLHRSRGQCFVPAEVLAAAGIDRDGWIAGHDAAAMASATQAMIALAQEHWTAFRKRAADVPPTLRPAFLPAALVPLYLSRLGPDAWRNAPSDPAMLRRHWQLFRRATHGWASI